MISARALLLLVGTLLCACGDRGGGGDDEADGDADADADADADGDADADADGDPDPCALPEDAAPAVIDMLVDSVPVTTCIDGRWRLNVRLCGEADVGECSDAAGGACGEGEGLLLGDACTTDTFVLPTAGRFTLCVDAELVNGFVTYGPECADIVVDESGLAEPIELDLDSEGTFPCVRDWHYDPDENMCCDYDVGHCVPPDF